MSFPPSARMDVSECVVAAGRAVLDVVEREWQPLSAGELEQRLDGAVEEMLEAEMMEKLRSQTSSSSAAPPPAVFVQLLRENTQPQPGHAAATREEEAAGGAGGQLPPVGGAAVKHISDLLQNSKSRARMAGRARLSLSHTVQLSLTLLSERISYRSVSRRFRLEKGNIHRIFCSFCECVNGLEEKHIRWPLGKEASEALFPLSSLLEKEREHVEEEEEEEQRVPQVLGVLGHTVIPIRLPIGKRVAASVPAPEVKRLRKEAHLDSWLNLELVCDRRGRFLHCRISAGSDTDRGGALRDRLQRHPELTPPGSVLVARAGFPLCARILTPYAAAPGPREELFNRTLEESLLILDRAVAALRARFQRLRYLDMGDYGRARAVVRTACVLHNVLLDAGEEVHADAEEEEEDAVGPEGDEEGDEEGARRRDAIADLLFKNSGST